MNPIAPNTTTGVYEACPKCGSALLVREKLILIDEFNAAHFRHHPEERSGCTCEGDLSVDGLRPEYVHAAPLQQFVLGLYCDACGKGFVPEHMAKPAPQRWKLLGDGWHRVREDGSIGPPENPPGRSPER